MITAWYFLDQTTSISFKIFSKSLFINHPATWYYIVWECHEMKTKTTYRKTEASVLIIYN
jgi:hypothetical protein